MINFELEINTKNKVSLVTIYKINNSKKEVVLTSILYKSTKNRFCILSFDTNKEMLDGLTKNGFIEEVTYSNEYTSLKPAILPLTEKSLLQML